MAGKLICFSCMNPVNALRTAFEMQMRAVEMVEAAARRFEMAALMGERIRIQSEIAKESLHVVLCKMWKIRNARS